MLTNHFYHEIIRKTIVSFGTLFNNIEIQHTSGGKTVSVIKVPISYGPQQKFLARVEQGRDYQDGVGTTLTLPRMSFEVMGMNYDATRKVSTMQTFISGFICLSFIAVERPDGPAPTITTSYSIDSLC